MIQRSTGENDADLLYRKEVFWPSSHSDRYEVTGSFQGDDSEHEILSCCSQETRTGRVNWICGLAK